jgi:hypothetical protein
MPTNPEIVDKVHQVLAQQDYSASNVADHHLQFTNPPKDVRPDSDHYYKNVLRGESQKIANQGAPGAAPKVCIQTEDGTKYMVKPYHEGIHPRSAPYMRYPSLGWSELTTQALYHAGGIGHLCSRSHVAVHQDKKRRLHPVVAIKLDPSITTTINHMAGYHGPHPDQLMKNAFKVAMMDFLTNHNDRHEHNLLFEPNELGAPSNLLACDNAAAFQYKVPNRFDRLHDKTDNLYYYVADSRGMKFLTNPNEHRFLWSNQNLSHGVNWWKNNGKAIRNEMDNQLNAIVHPAVRQFIRENFDQRANALDNLVNIHHPNIDADSYDPYIDGELSHVTSVPILRFHPR